MRPWKCRDGEKYTKKIDLEDLKPGAPSKKVERLTMGYVAVSQ